ncbi:DS13B phosphatase, partial [Circaetus pectoralis]|nr:DS13B phosphatase [Circaetus pectoralis]
LGVTHALNAAHFAWGSKGDQTFHGQERHYYGIPAEDLIDFHLGAHFCTASECVHKAKCQSNDSFFQKLPVLTNRNQLSLIQPECVQERSKMPHTRDSSSPTSSAGSRASYETPALSDLQRLFWFRGGSDNHVDQVWPNIYLGDAWAARSKTTLRSLNITHILNAADGPYSINTGAKYYEDLQIEYYGVEAFDDPSFDLSIFFYNAANFIGKALNTSGGKVFVHCAMGVSRSASLVLAFLMIHENMTLVDALKTVSAHRDICPNSGFLSQLRDLDIKLNEERKGTGASATKEL